MMVVMQKAYFKNIRNELVSLLEGAKEEVVVAMAWFTNAELFQSLISCLDRGVKVELILLDDPINWYPYAPDFNLFILKGGLLYIASPENGRMHNKFCVVDKEFSITGSYNWTYYAESRNHENIIILNNPDVSKAYQSEFNHLKSIQNVVKSSPKYDWAHIERMDHVNYEELNYEIQSYCRSYNVPYSKVIKSNAKVQIVEKRLSPKSAHTIGILASEVSGNVFFDPIIDKGIALPATKEMVFYSYLNSRSEMICDIRYQNSLNPDLYTELIRERITQITDNSDELTIIIRVTLDTNGYLHIEIQCKETGKAIDLTKTDIRLVEYGE